MPIRFLNPSIYGLLISLAILICILIAEQRVKHGGKQAQKLWDFSLVAIIFGLIGARIYHVIDFWPYYSQYPMLVFKFWQGGLGIWGAILGGMFGSLLFLKYKKEPTLYWMDVAAGVLPLGQSIGRWGNYFNQENFGYPTILPWGIYISPQNRPAEFAYVERFHPLFLYESILNLFLFLFLAKIIKKYPPGRGIVLASYLIGYSSIRFLLEFLKVNPWRVYGTNVAQIISSIVIVFTLVFIRNRFFFAWLASTRERS